MSVSLPPAGEQSGFDARLLDTQRAFDEVADEYDGPLGNNALVQRMRQAMWRAVEGLFPPGARLLDLGCGTGLDAVHLAEWGYRVVATDWSPRMAARARARAVEAGVGGRVAVEQVGIHELERLRGELFDGVYSNLGPFNCVSDLGAVAEGCAELLAPGGRMVVTVIGRACPWEWLYYTLRGDAARAGVRRAREAVPVGLRGRTVWTRYYRPREFYRAFAGRFVLSHYRALSLLLPPPYLVGVYERYRPLCEALGWLDDRVGGLPLARDAGDHFLMALSRREN